MRIQGTAIYADSSEYRIRRIDPNNENEPLTDWCNAMGMFPNETMANYEQKSLVEIKEEQSAAAQAAEAARLKAEKEAKYTELVREHYTELEEREVRDAHSDVDIKMYSGEQLNDADKLVLSNWATYRNICKECERMACNEIYGTDCLLNN